jgi:hypothetical protein
LMLQPLSTNIPERSGSSVPLNILGPQGHKS